MDKPDKSDLLGKVMRGTVHRWIDARRYGFITTDKSPSLTAVVFASDIKSNGKKLPPGCQVSFTLSRNRKGFMAKNCVAVASEESRTEPERAMMTECTHDSDAMPAADHNQPFSPQALPAKRRRLAYTQVVDILPDEGEDEDGVSMDDMSVASEKQFCAAYLTEYKAHLETLSQQNTATTAENESCSVSPAHDIATISVAAMALHAQRQRRQLGEQDVRSNTRRGDAAHAQRVLENWDRACTYLLLDPPLTMSEEVLCRVHRLITEGLLESAGRLRLTKTVRAGSEVFIPPQDVQRAVAGFVAEINAFLACEVYSMYALAAWVAFKGMKIHPFDDGNGRVFRLLCNWVLLRRGLPFAITFCSSPALRKRYIASSNGRSNGSSGKVGSSSTSTVVNEESLLGTAEMTKFVVSRVSAVWQQYALSCAIDTRKWSTTSVPSATDALVTSARQTLRRDVCGVCLEGAPSVSLLCCGKPAHLACLSAWRDGRGAGHATVPCPFCRGDISEVGVESHRPPPTPPPAPAVAPAVVAAAAAVVAAAAAALEDEDTTSTTSTASTASDEEGETTTSVCDEGSTTSTTGSGSGSGSEDEDEETTTTEVSAPPQRPKCSHCLSNPRAGSCANMCCGRCCGVTNRHEYCARHA